MSTSTSTFTAPPSVASQIARLPELPMPEIKALWQRLFGDDTPIVAAILDDAMPNHVTLFDLAVDPPAPWDDQRARPPRRLRREAA
jgi:hypothetical protein